MTSDQLEPSAHAPCTSTTLRASAGFPACAVASAAKRTAESIPTATAADFHCVFICRTPYRLRPVLLQEPAPAVPIAGSPRSRPKGVSLTDPNGGHPTDVHVSDIRKRSPHQAGSFAGEYDSTTSYIPGKGPMIEPRGGTFMREPVAQAKLRGPCAGSRPLSAPP